LNGGEASTIRLPVRFFQAIEDKVISFEPVIDQHSLDQVICLCRRTTGSVTGIPTILTERGLTEPGDKSDVERTMVLREARIVKNVIHVEHGNLPCYSSELILSGKDFKHLYSASHFHVETSQNVVPDEVVVESRERKVFRETRYGKREGGIGSIGHFVWVVMELIQVAMGERVLSSKR
jgi:hypothetical protein